MRQALQLFYATKYYFGMQHWHADWIILTLFLSYLSHLIQFSVNKQIWHDMSLNSKKLGHLQKLMYSQKLLIASSRAEGHVSHLGLLAMSPKVMCHIGATFSSRNFIEMHIGQRIILRCENREDLLWNTSLLTSYLDSFSTCVFPVDLTMALTNISSACNWYGDLHLPKSAWLLHKFFISLTWIKIFAWKFQLSSVQIYVFH